MRINKSLMCDFNSCSFFFRGYSDNFRILSIICKEGSFNFFLSYFYNNFIGDKFLGIKVS